MKILAGIDFTAVSDQVVDQSIKYAKCFGAKLWLVHVAAPDPDFVGYDVGPKVIRDQRAKVLREEHKKLQDYALIAKSRGVRSVPLLVQGATIETLLEVLNRLNVDLVVVGSHKHSTLYDFVMGSVRTEIFQKAKIPVLLVPENIKSKSQ